MKILLLAYCFAHSNANTFRYRELVRELSLQGDSIDIIGHKTLENYILPDNCKYQSTENIFSLKSFFPIVFYTIIELFKSVRLWKASLKNHYIGYNIILNGVIRYLINKELKVNTYDVIIMSVVPWTHYNFAKRLSKKAPLIIDISDPLYKNAVEDSTPEGSCGFKKYEQQAISYATHIIVMSEPLIDVYTQDLGVAEKKITFISPASNIDICRATPQTRYSLSDSIKILYAGSVYPGYRDMNQIIPVIQSINGYKLSVISQKSPAVEHNIEYKNWMSQSELKQEYLQSDILLFIDNFFGYQVPSKIFELLAMNKPILFVYDNRNLYLYNMLKGQQGIFFAENNTESISQTLNEITTLKEITVDYTFDLEPYSNAYMCRRMLQVISQTVNYV